MHTVTSSLEIKVMAKGSIMVYKGKQIPYKRNPPFSMLLSFRTRVFLSGRFSCLRKGILPVGIIFPSLFSHTNALKKKKIQLEQSWEGKLLQTAFYIS